MKISLYLQFNGNYKLLYFMKTLSEISANVYKEDNGFIVTHPLYP